MYNRKFITVIKLSLALVDLAVSAAMEARPLPLRSSLAGIGRVAKTISRL